MVLKIGALHFVVRAHLLVFLQGPVLQHRVPLEVLGQALGSVGVQLFLEQILHFFFHQLLVELG